MRSVILEIQGKKVEAMTAYAKGVLWIHMNGETYTYEEPKRGRRGSKTGAAAANPGEILAPMPGKIIKIAVQAGAKVSAQQVLLVMEAMKMEYTLKAQSDGVVSEVNCAANDQVTLGQLLIKLDV